MQCSLSFPLDLSPGKLSSSGINGPYAAVHAGSAAPSPLHSSFYPLSVPFTFF